MQSNMLIFREQFLKRAKMQFPNGVQPYQHRDVVRTYFMGFCDALLAAGRKTTVELLLKECFFINDDNWWPTTDWTWWERKNGG